MQLVCPLPLSNYACNAVQTAWSGAAYDTRRDRLVVFGGGHSDSFYNNLFAYDLGAMQWSRLTELPAGATGQAPTAAMRWSPMESCGFYPTAIPALDAGDYQGQYVNPAFCDRPDLAAVIDFQQPRSSHTYGKLFYVHALDEYCYLGGGTYPGAQTFPPWGVCYGFSTGQWRRLVRSSSVAGRGTTATDATGAVWYLTDDSGPIARYEPTDGGWRLFGNVNYDAQGTADVDRRRNHLWLLREADPLLHRYDLADAGRLAQSRGAPDRIDGGAGDVPTVRRGDPGFVYADGHDRFYAWLGGQEVFELDPATVRWTRLAPLGDDPGPQLTWGTYGRLRYSARFDVLVLVNGADQDVFIFKLP